MNARVQPVAVAEAQAAPFATHEVRNQARPALGFNAFDDDRALSGLIATIAPWATDKLSALGAHAGSESVQEAARLANKHEPTLLTHDRYGNRNDWVEFHPAWHELMALAFRSEVHSLAWSTREPHGHLARAALSYLWNQIENGVGCPTGMAYAAIAGFSGKPQFNLWRERTLAADYDPRRLPIEAKRAAVIGYAMTEKQGGSDLRETQTTARFVERGAHGEIYAITGHKWFFSVPVADGFYTLARTQSGVSCLFVPRLLPDGSANRIHIQRLKDKCGNRSNASSEIEYHDTWSILVGEEGRGIAEILSHAHLTRLDFAVGSAGLMRQALSFALNHAQTRTAFGKPTSELPMQRNVLADLALESEAAMLGAFRVARATDGLQTSEHERLLARVATPVMKFWNCQRAPAFTYECLQVHGGNGFIMENPMARLYREAPLNSIWEGTSNMMCMDVLRAMQRDANCRDAFVDELRASRGLNPVYDRSTDDLADRLRARYPDDGHARALVTRMAHALQAAEMLRHGDTAAADLFVQSRLDADGMHVFGGLPPSEGLSRIVARASVIRHQGPQ
ncbi:acyl-CoA dehydrogenase family protein [Bradyrhizobium elkanii]|uniref:Acyl-CoA dehydrogenase n=1 Tax=Bradyrhizobium elkanii TaxID=29448 RepID=A0ABV4EWC5_BRAEL|nr:acyl-CoA dehydrogenase family protein [Bradyrhizobium elkanii]MCP1756479.1 putative acyl-CoA dehydrogenase [Bradyrhizobium elkanii]MCP1981992.1 putative acyl-CoA dehydrogenase [Bradyrhizobium elkanii]MCS3883224.1 putative acyl-CoA dehydrogenase [Bradyrhizobium elkanii]MCS4217719.1 putative acyl-CoA dehydrogenase [Bradyrhizobium elkanii]MCW2195817.1 putative acyl-CoA dehydrogenase [Bradyrhizobium elkanii]